MNFNNFTIKSQEAVQEAVNLVQSRGQQAIEPEHLMAGLLKVGENVTNFIFQKLGINGQQIETVLDRQIASLPKVSGGEAYLSRSANEVLQKALEVSKELGEICAVFCLLNDQFCLFHFHKLLFSSYAANRSSSVRSLMQRNVSTIFSVSPLAS